MSERSKWLTLFMFYWITISNLYSLHIFLCFLKVHFYSLPLLNCHHANVRNLFYHTFLKQEILYVNLLICVLLQRHRLVYMSVCLQMAWVGFKPTTTGFRPDALTDWTIRPWVQLDLRANFVQLPNFISLFSVHVSFRSLPSSVATFALSEVSHK